MVNVFPPTGKEGETSRKHGAAVLGLIASHVYSRSAIIQMRVRIQLHTDARTNTVAHIKLLMQSWTQFLMYSCSRLLLYCTHMLLHSCILVLMYIQALQSLSVRNPWPPGPQQGVSSCIISFDCIWTHKFKQEYVNIYTHKYKYERNHLVSPASCHQARQPCTGRQSCLLSLSPDEKISIVVLPKHQILIF